MATPAKPPAKRPESSPESSRPGKPSRNRSSNSCDFGPWAGNCYLSRGCTDAIIRGRLLVARRRVCARSRAEHVASVAAEGKHVKLRIEARAPTRIDLAGGTLDIWPLYLFHPGALTVNCAITRYASCVVETQSARGPAQGSIRLVSRDTKRRETFPSLAALDRARSYRLPLLAHLVRFFRPGTGLTLTTDSQAPAGAGIGGSSAMAVAICAALDRLTGAARRLEDWIHISRDAEAIVIRVPTGTQDHYPPAFGGACAIHLEPGGERREEIGCDLDELERRLVLCYTGKPRQSGINNWEVFERHIRGERSRRGRVCRSAHRSPGAGASGSCGLGGGGPASAAWY
jgi:galactokinase